MKKLVVSVCVLSVAVGAGVMPARQAQAGFWGKAAAGAVALAAGYYLGKRMNPPNTTYIIQQPSSGSSYDSGPSEGAELASYLAERDRQAGVMADENASRAPERVYEKPDWRAAELAVLVKNRPHIKELQKQIHEKVIAAEREMTPDRRWACFAICGRFGVGKAYGASMTLDGEAIVTTGADESSALSQLNQECGAKYKAYHLFMDLDADYFIKDAKVSEICGPLKPSKEACANSIPAAISNTWSNAKSQTDGLQADYDERKARARQSLLRLANRAHEFFDRASKDSDFSGAKGDGRISAAQKILDREASGFQYRDCDKGGSSEERPNGTVLCALPDGTKYMPRVADFAEINSYYGTIELCTAENSSELPVDKRVSACVTLKLSELLNNDLLRAIEATGANTLIEGSAYDGHFPVTIGLVTSPKDYSFPSSSYGAKDYLFGGYNGYQKFGGALSDGQDYLAKNPTEHAALEHGLVEIGCKPAKQKHAELELPGVSDGVASKGDVPSNEGGVGNGKKKKPLKEVAG
ncbi:MAG: hypothetical protein HY075_03425 [Deltaproteobacteria bacterium]|nr:hypothetical protein [Deltaproteobacteria bacterium]